MARMKAQLIQSPALCRRSHIDGESGMSYTSIASPATCYSALLEHQHLHRSSISSTMSAVLHSAMHSDCRSLCTHDSRKAKWQHGAADVDCLAHFILSRC